MQFSRTWYKIENAVTRREFWTELVGESTARNVRWRFVVQAPRHGRQLRQYLITNIISITIIAMSSSSLSSVYLMCAQVAPSGECLQGNGPPDRIGAVCFWQSAPSGANLVVAVLHDSVCAVSLLSCVADCCIILHNVVRLSGLS